MLMQIEEEELAPEMKNEGETAATEPFDQWKAEGFSTQTVFPAVIKTSLIATIWLGVTAATLALPLLVPYLREDCAIGFYEKDRVPGSLFNFMHENICGKCQAPFCGVCQATQGATCETCKEGHHLVDGQPPKCVKCEFEADKCRACANATTCTKCDEGYTIRPKKENITLTRTDAATGREEFIV